MLMVVNGVSIVPVHRVSGEKITTLTQIKKWYD